MPSGLVSDNYAAREKLSLLLISQLALKECFASLKPGWGVIFFSPPSPHTVPLSFQQALSLSDQTYSRYLVIKKKKD